MADIAVAPDDRTLLPYLKHPSSNNLNILDTFITKQANRMQIKTTKSIGNDGKGTLDHLNNSHSPDKIDSSLLNNFTWKTRENKPTTNKRVKSDVNNNKKSSPEAEVSSGTVKSAESDKLSKSERYKTELCRSFDEAGWCKYGNKCQFAHGLNELRECEKHPKYKTQLCKAFHSDGFCKYGRRCHFIHRTDEDRSQLTADLNQGLAQFLTEQKQDVPIGMAGEANSSKSYPGSPVYNSEKNTRLVKSASCLE